MGFAHSVLVNWMTRNCQYLRFYLWSIDFLQRMNSLIGSLVVGTHLRVSTCLFDVFPGRNYL